MDAMKPMAGMAPLQAIEAWWPGDLGQPASQGSQGDVRYAVFPARRRLLIDQGGTVTAYDTGDRRLEGVAQGGAGGPLAFTGPDGAVRLDELTPLD